MAFGNRSLYSVFIIEISLSIIGERLGLLQLQIKIVCNHKVLAQVDLKRNAVGNIITCYLKLRDRGLWRGERWVVVGVSSQLPHGMDELLSLLEKW